MTDLRRSISALVAMVAFATTAALLTPTQLLANARPHRLVLEQAMPTSFGDWRLDNSAVSAIVNPEDAEVLNKIYTQTLSRVYVNGHGDRVMVALAYGADQSKREGLQLHYPEVCYPAQGFEVKSVRVEHLDVGPGTIPVRRLETVLSGQRFEPVTYWTMSGDYATLGGMNKKAIEFRYSLKGQITDGLLFRVSTVGRDTPAQFAVQTQFVRDLIKDLAPESRRALTGLS